ncbi:flagellar basal body rod protein FlgB [Roseomonas elaeocarpi]|uniref:Flagellar basal body rod protein FlgB n=1 Tax=Roseomonas elaeocarpi TaxID=907779 RepID=A0ABV6JSR4_9PROT
MAEQRLRWLDRRQSVLAQNIANADTPHYRARDVTPFAEVLAGTAGPALAATQAGHIQPSGAGQGRVVSDRRATEEAPDGNAVSLEDQALKVAETDTAHQLATGLRNSWMGMFRTALGQR